MVEQNVVAGIDRQRKTEEPWTNEQNKTWAKRDK